MNPLQIFKPKSALQIAIQNLETAKREQLVALAHAEYQTMLAQYYSNVVLRLTKYIADTPT